MSPSFTAVIGSAIGVDPFNRRSWSGSSFFFFSEMKRQGLLNRAFGVEAPAVQRLLHLGRNFSPDRGVWRARLNLDVNYRKSLTHAVGRQLTNGEKQGDVLQIGGYFSGPEATGRQGRCFAYYDGNLAIRLRAKPPLKDIPARLIDGALDYERRMLPGMEKVFTMSEYLRRSFITDYGLRPEQVQTIGAGINLDSFPPPPVGKNYEQPTVLFVGADFARKGGWELLQAWPQVRDRFPQAELHIVGPRELTIPPELGAGVRHHGFVSKDDPRFFDLFAKASLFVMPSLYEPFGIAPLEAMAHAIPAVVTDDWALGEMVTSGVTGEKVPAGDTRSLADTLLELLAAPDRLQTMGQAARQHVLDNYTWSATVTRLAAAAADRSHAAIAGQTAR